MTAHGTGGGALLAELRAMIAAEGPIGVDRFMALALGHPKHGYYMARDPFGTAGDFTTAPEISQMFGELLGLWAAEVWHGMGRPDPVRLVELGPGRGTLMADALRAARALPPFRAALDTHLVETSPVLRAAQKRSLAAQMSPVAWHESVATLPGGPLIVLANEFFDALPIRQFVRTPRGWCERLVGLDADNALVFGLHAEPSPGIELATADGSVLEVNAVAHHVMRTLAARAAAHGGAILAIDYGHAASGVAETLQAVKAHRFVHPLTAPGDADLTAHVDFAALASAGRAEGLAVHGPVTQGDFLQALGLARRAMALASRATPAQAAAIESAVARLAGPDPGMGELFKVMAVAHPDLPPPPGFAQEPQP